MLWPAENAPQVLDAYRKITATAPEELTVWYELLQFPGSPALVAVDSTFLGERGEGRALLRDLDRIDGMLSDSRSTLAVADLGSITAEPTDPGPGLSRAELLTDLDDEVAAALLARPIDPLLNVQIRHLGGALTRPADSAAGRLDEPYALYLFGIPATPEAEAAVRNRQLGAPYGTRTFGSPEGPASTTATTVTVRCSGTADRCAAQSRRVGSTQTAEMMPGPRPLPAASGAIRRIPHWPRATFSMRARTPTTFP